MRIWLALLISTLSCGAEGHPPVPNLIDPTCSWVERETYTAPECMVLTPYASDARFVAEGDESCEGEETVTLQAGESATVVGPITDLHVDYEWTACP